MIFKKINTDLAAFVERDPAAPNRFWVVILWPGFHAIVLYRLSHWFWNRKKIRFMGRLLSGFSRFLTSVDIHPGAKIGEAFVIDHATGVVIGETTVIGNNVTIYHGVTLGGLSPSVDSISQIGVKRHPTLSDNVIVGSGATILGDIHIGRGACIGANAVVTKDVAENVTMVGNPAQVIDRHNKSKRFQAYGVDSKGVPDIFAQEISALKQQIKDIQQTINESCLDRLSKEKKTHMAQKEDDIGGKE